MKTLAELRAQKKTPARPTRVLKVCLDLDLLADVQRLETEKRDLEVEWHSKTATDDEGDTKRPRKMGESKPKRLSEIDDELAVFWDRMRDNEGELLLRARDGGEWLRWKDEHPAREGNESDERFAFGLCNATDLAEDLSRYVAEWNGEALAPDDWSGWLGAQIAPADIGEAVKTVVEMHETRISVPKSLSGSSATEPRETA